MCTVLIFTVHMCTLVVKINGLQMETSKKEQRQNEIETAAYALLEKIGYKKTSMLAIAKKASASNETLYKWYGNKQNLFASLVEKNAETVEKELQDAIESQADALKSLAVIGPLILKLVSSEKAIALNRAAAIDVNENNTLGRTIAEQGKKKITPLLIEIIQQGIDKDVFINETNNTASEISQVYLSLLIGDIQVQRVIGVKEVINKNEIEQRSNLALKCIKQLYIN